MIDGFIIVLAIIIGLLCIMCYILDFINRRKENKRLENTPIEVYRYTYKVYLNDGTEYQRNSVGWFAFDFDNFIHRCILTDDTLRVNKTIVVNVENITRFELIETQKETIKPILESHVGEKFIREVYYPEEVIKQKLLNKTE